MGEKKRRLALGAPVPAPAATRDADALLIEAEALLREGDARNAFKRAQEALALAPGSHQAFYVLGRCCLAVGQAQTAVGLLQSAVAARPDDPTYRAELGRAHVSTGRLQEALEHLRGAAAALADAQIHRDAGAVLLHLGRAREAEDAYARAAHLAPDRADLHEALARLRYERGAIAEACADFDRAVALDPTLVDRLNLGFARATAHPGDDGPASAAARIVQPRPGLRAYADGDAAEAAVRLACEARSLCVIDNFLDNPLAYRQAALQLDYPHTSQRAGINYPGAQSAPQPCAAIMERIADALGRDIKWDSPDNGAFRISPADANARNDIHIDSETRNEIYAGVLYLSLPEHCRGGTLFWRHRVTGWERRPAPDQLAAAGYASFRKFEQRWMPTNRLRAFSELQQQREADWEVVLQVPMRFNRLVVYRSDFFHSIGELFGDRPENARFVQLFFFEAAFTST